MVWASCMFLLFGGVCTAKTVEDAMGRKVEVPEKVDRVICSGAGALRLLVYLGAQDRIVAVDDMEVKRQKFDARPYALANPQFKTFPIFGEFRGHDHPERIVALDPQPQVIIKTYRGMGLDPEQLETKTGVPVVVLDYGDLNTRREQFYAAVTIMAKVVGKEKRGKEVIAFFDDAIHELQNRTKDLEQSSKPTCYVGGIASRGPHGYQSTEPGYPPFAFLGADNLAGRDFIGKQPPRHSSIAKEKIVSWDPEYLFVDLSTIQLGKDAGAIHELRNDPAYQHLTAVKNGRVYGLLPYNWYTSNYGSILANAYYIGKVLYPEKFKDIDPAKKADEIYTFLVGKPVFDIMKKAFAGLVFEPVPVK